MGSKGRGARQKDRKAQERISEDGGERASERASESERAQFGAWRADRGRERFFPSINTGFIETESIPGSLGLLIHHISNPRRPLTLPIIPPLLYRCLKPSYPGPSVTSLVRPSRRKPRWQGAGGGGGARRIHSPECLTNKISLNSPARAVNCSSERLRSLTPSLWSLPSPLPFPSCSPAVAETQSWALDYLNFHMESCVSQFNAWPVILFTTLQQAGAKAAGKLAIHPISPCVCMHRSVNTEARGNRGSFVNYRLGPWRAGAASPDATRDS